MKVALFGLGRMGKAVCHLLKNTEDFKHFEIHGFDCFQERPPWIEVDEYHCFEAETLYKRNPLHGKDFDLVFSCLPYHCNESVANLATAVGAPYFDLGGSVPVSKKINETYGKLRGATVFTDLGLAPGWVNVMAEEAFDTLVSNGLVKEIKMRCGGLPASQYGPHEDPFGYAGTWSPEGLYNEYVDDCEILEWGEIKTEPGMLGLESVKTQGVIAWQGCHTPLEAFYTSGGASHTIQLMKNRGVEHCSYKTLRYQGHRDLVWYFTQIKKYNTKQLSELFTPHPEGDIVLLDVWARSENLEYRKAHIIRCDEGLSAMQKATAAGLIAGALSSNYGQHRPLTYADIDIDVFNQIIGKLGILKWA